jgi:hypothetical protein
VADGVGREPVSGVRNGRHSQPYLRCYQPSAFP